MYTVSRQIPFCYGHRLIDYPGKCRHLHGHSARAEITLEGEALDARGMLCDFFDIKREIGAWIDAELDHTLLLHKDDPLLPLLREAGERVRSTEINPTAEHIARLIFEHARTLDWPVVEVRVWESDSACAGYARREAGRSGDRAPAIS